MTNPSLLASLRRPAVLGRIHRAAAAIGSSRDPQRVSSDPPAPGPVVGQADLPGPGRVAILTSLFALTSPAHAADQPSALGHPRLYFGEAELVRLRELRGSGVHARIWANLAESADWCLTRPLRKEWIAPVAPDPVHLNLYDRFYAMMHDMAVMEHLAFAFAYSGDERYGQAAKDWTLACCRVWQREAEGAPDGGKAYAVSRLLKGLAVGYDCLHAQLAEAEREEVRSTIARIGQAYYDGYFATPAVAGPGFHTHHAIVEWGSFGVAALALLEEYQPATDWLAATVQKFSDHLLPNGLAPDGAQVEGATFWASTMHYRLFFMDALRRVTGRDLFQSHEVHLNADLALAAITAMKQPGHDEDQQTVLLEPSYGQLNYYAPILLALARAYRKPLYQHLALWDHSLGAIQWTRYVTSNGEQLLFELGGYAYAWYDPDVPAEVESEAPLSFQFPSVNEVYARQSYQPGGVVVGARQGQLAIHAGGQPVLLDLSGEVGAPTAPELNDPGDSAVIVFAGSTDGAYTEQTVALQRPGFLTVGRKTAKAMRWWCHGRPALRENALTWPDGTVLSVTKGRLVSMDPEGYRDEKVVGMGLLKLVDPLPMRYPVVVAEPDADGELVLEITPGTALRTD